MNTIKKPAYLTAIFFTLCFKIYSQVSVVTISFNSLQAVPEAILNIGLLNSGVESTVIVEGTLFNSNHDVILYSKSLPIHIQARTSYTFTTPNSISESGYGSTAQAEYARVHHFLPSGNYSLCYRVFNETGEEIFDNCFDVVSDYNSILNLISPSDEEVLDNFRPLLIWFHNEPFDILNQGEFYRIIICEIWEGQSPGEAISANIPVYHKDGIRSHQILYPIDGIALKEGSSYSWQVEKITGSSIIQKTEAWSFSIRKHEVIKDIKYAILKKELDAGAFTIQNNNLYFRFDESYRGGQIDCTVFGKDNKPIMVDALNQTDDSVTVNEKFHGYNRYLVNLEPYHLNKGVYVLQVKNSKNEIFKMKFNIE